MTTEKSNEVEALAHPDHGKPVILCMYSGGLDSVGMLNRLLSDERYSGYQIHVHHMHLVNRENRARAEHFAVSATLEEFKKVHEKSFLITQSTHDYRFMHKRFIWDMDFCAFMAANIAIADNNIVHVAMGRTKTDVEGSSESFQGRMNRAQKIVDAVWDLEERQRPEYIFPMLEFSKAEIWNLLSPALQQRVWSCRHPVYTDKQIRACGKCMTCNEMKKFRTQS